MKTCRGDEGGRGVSGPSFRDSGVETSRVIGRGSQVLHLVIQECRRLGL